MKISSPIRSAALALAALALSACSSEGNMGWRQIYDAAKMSLGGDAGAVTLEQASAISYASIGVRIGDGPEQMLVLAADMQGGRLWTSSAHIALSTRGGRIVRSSGLPHNLSGSEGGDALAGFADANARPREIVRQVDLQDLNLFSVALQCHIESKGADPVTILGAKIETHRVEETCRSERPDWSFTDIFWMDDSGFVWKSVQHVHPDLDAVTIEVLRPPAG
jgi:hypothetical protein